MLARDLLEWWDYRVARSTSSEHAEREITRKNSRQDQRNRGIFSDDSLLMRFRAMERLSLAAELATSKPLWKSESAPASEGTEPGPE